MCDVLIIALIVAFMAAAIIFPIYIANQLVSRKLETKASAFIVPVIQALRHKETQGLVVRYAILLVSIPVLAAIVVSFC